MSCHVMTCPVMSCHVMSCHVMSWVMTCHVMSCHDMPCHVNLCPLALFAMHALSLIIPPTHSRHGTAARLAAPPESNTPTSRRKATGRPVPSASDSQRTQPWSPSGVFYPWLQARCACNNLTRHASQGIVSPRAFPTHAPNDALHVWALRICTAGQ